MIIYDPMIKCPAINGRISGHKFFCNSSQYAVDHIQLGLFFWKPQHQLSKSGILEVR